MYKRDDNSIDKSILCQSFHSEALIQKNLKKRERRRKKYVVVVTRHLLSVNQFETRTLPFYH